jgi:PadR family transcriptional regulator PadR
MLKGVLPVMVLATLSNGDTYGYEIVRRLREAGLTGVGNASVYGTLQRVADSKLVRSYLVESDSGPARRYYTLTKTGRTALAQGRASWHDMQAAVTTVLDEVEGE